MDLPRRWCGGEASGAALGDHHGHGIPGLGGRRVGDEPRGVLCAEGLGRAGKIAFSERWTEDRVIPAYVALAERAREMKS